tara:strand:+ start:159 stop:404 length:246 start_codon:yes stop_codon:yes gene_type:complete
MGVYTPSNIETKASLWCINNNICIAPRQAKWGQSIWFIDIEKGVYPNRQKMGTSPEAYGPVEIWKKTFEYKLYYYNKYAKK